MPALYVTSTETFAGKSAVCVGLASRWLKDGFIFGYMKPVSRAIKIIAGRPVDEDAQFFKNTFGLQEPLELLTPIALTPQWEEAILRGQDQTDFLKKVTDAYAEIARGRDLMLLEAGTNLREGYLIGLPTPHLAEILNAQELVVIRYNDNLVDDILAAQWRLGPLMLGVVINAVPRPRWDYVSEVIRPYLEQRGIAVLGILPHEQLLQSVSVRELAQILAGEILCAHEAADELVEHLMIGAMSVNSALAYFRSKPNKAVITGGDRPDIQLAALETSTRCLILTGNLYPSSVILARATEVNVPVILVKYDTFTTVQIIEQFFGRTRFHQQKKVQRFVELLEEWFDFNRLYEKLNLHKAAKS